MALTPKQLLEQLNQRLSGTKNDDPGPSGADDIDELEGPDPDAYPADFGPLKASLKKVFGAEAFLFPEKENDEVMCVYFDPEIYKLHADEFAEKNLQDWCTSKGFAVFSKIPGKLTTKVYFTPIREVEPEGKEEPGKEFSTSSFGKVPSGTNK
jgi:hypothetical protein